MSLRRFPSGLPTAPRGWSRALSVIVLALQAFLWGGGSMLEARSAAESLTRYSHIEDQGTTACPPIHSHLDCVVCRTLSSGALTARARDLVPAGQHDVTAAPATVEGLTANDGSGPLGSRAPPGLVTTPDRTIA
jgi:hypothetical protein